MKHPCENPYCNNITDERTWCYGCWAYRRRHKELPDRRVCGICNRRRDDFGDSTLVSNAGLTLYHPSCSPDIDFRHESTDDYWRART